MYRTFFLRIKHTMFMSPGEEAPAVNASTGSLAALLSRFRDEGEVSASLQQQHGAWLQSFREQMTGSSTLAAAATAAAAAASSAGRSGAVKSSKYVSSSGRVPAVGASLPCLWPASGNWVAWSR